MSANVPFARTSQDTDTTPPPVTARFFYQSPQALDDPLAPITAPTAGPTHNNRYAPKPFSAFDSSALDRAWVDLQAKIKIYHKALELEAKHAPVKKVNEWDNDDQPGQLDEPGNDTLKGGRRVIASQPRRSRTPSLSTSRASRNLSEKGLGRSNSLRTREHRQSAAGDTVSSSPHTPVGADNVNGGTTGTPFVRAPARSEKNDQSVDRKASMPILSRKDEPIGASYSDSSDLKVQEGQVGSERPADAKVMVGAARIHHVSMPKLDLEPTYWTPVNDVAPVTRATWFYKDNMLPVEVDIATMLESGYISVRAWTQTWNDELRSAVEVGAIGEEKIVHPLWPDNLKLVTESRPNTSTGSWMFDGSGEDLKEQKFQEKLKTAREIIARASEGTEQDNAAAGTNTYGKDGTLRRFSQMSVIYADGKTAYLLKPNLRPSEYYGRRPLANHIRRGHDIGVCVVRGFDEVAWNALHPSKTPRLTAVPGSSQARPSLGNHSSSSALLGLQPKTTDLVLVIHGIGQKLSERMESYHFTHAMNAFRREINVELASTGIRTNLRKEAGGIMILPVNWRATLSFDEGGYRDGPEDPTVNSFTLKDITPDSLTSVRNIVSDVMLDIPYYLSHHQPKMIAAVIKEANRIYHLWCQNNPGFERYGRVHLCAHSLGSVMSLDILSNQPTRVAESGCRILNDHFAFDTTNLYLLGSPVGFFLLLRKASLLPRRDRKKPASDGEESKPGVTGERGEFGCIAVDNVYNIVNSYDPVAYRVNAAVDAHWSETLKQATIPSVKQAWYSWSGSDQSTYGSSVSGPSGLRPNLPNLPSQVELETHNFTREELAEKRAYLLNDNGQIDFFLRYGGGPLEIQYLTMLSAHSSYWGSKDFIRFLVMEIGRRPGKDGALQALRPVKKREYRSAAVS